jgi:hypothetical protein
MSPRQSPAARGLGGQSDRPHPPELDARVWANPQARCCVDRAGSRRSPCRQCDRQPRVGRAIGFRRKRSPRPGCRDDRIRDGAIVRERCAWLALLGASMCSSGRGGRLDPYRSTRALAASGIVKASVRDGLAWPLLTKTSHLAAKRQVAGVAAKRPPADGEIGCRFRPARGQLEVATGAAATRVLARMLQARADGSGESQVWRRLRSRSASRGMKMPFEGSGRSGPKVWFIRDRGLHWENADG